MKKTLTTAALLALLALALPAAAADQGHTVARAYNAAGLGYAQIVDDGDLSSTVSYTVNLTKGQGATVDGPALYSRIKVTVDLTWAAASELQIVWKCSLDGSVSGTETSRDPSGTPTLTAYQDTLTVGASGTWNVAFGVAGCRTLTIDLTSTGGTTDTADVYAVATAGS